MSTVFTSRWRLFAAILLALSVVSFAYHLAFDAQSDVFNQLLSDGIILVSIATVGMLAKLAGPDRPLNGATRWTISSIAIVAAIGGVFALLYIRNITLYGPWSEEVWWTEQAKEIVKGVRLNPIGFKGDHPANFQGFPSGLFLWLTGDPLLSTRLPGALYALGAMIFVVKSIALFTKRPISLLSWLFPLLSVCSVHYARSGWNEMNAVPFLVSMQFYLFLKGIIQKSDRSLILFALATGLSFWTLYTPFLLSLILCGAMLVLPSALLDIRRKVIVGLSVLLICMPTICKVIHFPDQSLGRHKQFAMGGEWGRQFDETYRPLPTYEASFVSLGQHILPPRKPLTQTQLLGINLEATTFGFLLVGIGAVLLHHATLVRLFLLGVPVLQIAGVVLSNPSSSTWRELCLLPFLLVLAGIGVQTTFASLRPSIRRVGALILVSVHCALFLGAYLRTEVGQFGDWTGGAARSSYEALKQNDLMDRPIIIVDAAHGLFERYLQALHRTEFRTVKFRTTEQLGKVIPAIESVVVTTNGDLSVPSTEEVAAFLKEGGYDFKEIPVVDSAGVDIGELFLVSARVTSAEADV